MRKLALFLGIAFLTCCENTASNYSRENKIVSGEVNKAEQTDFKSYPKEIDEVIDNYYEAISGRGEKDFGPLDKITLETAQMNAMGINEQGENQYFPQNLKQYKEHLAPYIKEKGFYQRQVFRKVDFYNRIAQVWSVYESRNTPDGEIIDRGIYSFQLVKSGGEWKIANVLWNSETEREKVPQKYWFK